MYEDLDEETLLEHFAAELETHEAPLTFVLRPAVALTLAALLQLALRHPRMHTTAVPVPVATMFLAHVREYFADCPAALEVLRRGDAGTETGTRYAQRLRPKPTSRRGNRS